MLLENTKTIEAPPKLVWNVTCDVENWPQWTPTVNLVTRVDPGAFAVGSIAKIQQPGMAECEWKVTRMFVGTSFTWETQVMGMRMSATHEVLTSGTGTDNILRLEVRGILAVLLWPMLRSSIRKNLEAENSGLKKYCEELQAKSTQS